jgi:hypothetical protein
MAITFSQAVVSGLRSRGFSEAAIRALLAISNRALQQIISGKKELSAALVAKIENRTDLTGGQLAALALEPLGGPFTELMAGWGEVRRETLRAARATKPAK